MTNTTFDDHPCSKVEALYSEEQHQQNDIEGQRPPRPQCRRRGTRCGTGSHYFIGYAKFIFYELSLLVFIYILFKFRLLCTTLNLCVIIFLYDIKFSKVNKE